jgi:hypothetical protein
VDAAGMGAPGAKGGVLLVMRRRAPRGAD